MEWGGGPGGALAACGPQAPQLSGYYGAEGSELIPAAGPAGSSWASYFSLSPLHNTPLRT